VRLQFHSLKSNTVEQETSILQKLEKIESLVTEQNLLRKDMLSFDEACTFLQLSASSLYKMTSQHRIPFYRPNGKRIYFKRAELEQWLQMNKRAADYELEARAEDFIIKQLKKKEVNNGGK
jgi:excisionase family DNA binding protein